MKATEILEKISDVLQLSENKEVKLESQKLKNGTVLEAKSFEPEAEVFIVTEDERVALPEGEYELEDGRSLVVSEDGVIDTISVMEEEAVEAEVKEEVAEVSEELAEEPSEEDVVEYVSKEEFDKLGAVVSELEMAIKSLLEVKEEPIEEEVVVEETKEELSKEVVETELAEVELFTHSPEKSKNEVKLTANKKSVNSIYSNVLNFLNK